MGLVPCSGNVKALLLLPFQQPGLEPEALRLSPGYLELLIKEFLLLPLHIQTASAAVGNSLPTFE